MVTRSRPLETTWGRRNQDRPGRIGVVDQELAFVDCSIRVTKVVTRRTSTGPLALRAAPSTEQGGLTPALTCVLPGADDGIRTRDPHLGKVPGALFRPAAMPRSEG
jgi:hypothetical protein